MNLTEDLAHQGYVLFTDNFYTSPTLATSLLNRETYLVGTVSVNRRGIPEELNYDTNAFENHAERWSTRYVRQGDILVQQWKDKRVVSMLSSVHRGNAHVAVTRNTKVDRQHVQLELRQPKCIHDYNKKMGGVDSFDQQAAAYRALRRTRKYWKSIFLDIIDVAAVNSFIMFEIARTHSAVLKLH